MKILLCPDKCKGSLSAQEVCDALRSGIASLGKEFQITNLPMADGGDGSIEVLNSFLDLTPTQMTTSDPLGRSIEAVYYHNEATAFIELASASGLSLLDKTELDPLRTTTRGTGKMIQPALDQGFRHIYLFVGGSATNDGGIGIAEALGFKFRDKNGNDIEPIGENLRNICSVANHTIYNFENINITVLSDVTNPMYGPNGAAYVYGAQKGASTDDILILDNGLRNYSSVLESQAKVDFSDLPGIGAAGAVGASLVALLNAKIENGFQLLAGITQLDEKIKEADIVITGEGKIDSTSFQGKVVGNILARCNEYNVPCGIVCGILEEVQSSGIDLKFSKTIISLAKNQDDAMSNPKKYLYHIGRDIVRDL